MMESLIVIAFVLVSPDGSRRVEIERPWDGSLQTCQLFGQVLIAEIRAEYPSLELDGGWTCSSESSRDA